MNNKTNFKKIKIYGLFKKKNIEIKLDNLVNILISENGAGKTSILNIIVGIFTNNKKILRDIEFEKVEIQLENEEITELTKVDLISGNNTTLYFQALMNYINNEDPSIEKILYHYIKSGKPPKIVNMMLKRKLSRLQYAQVLDIYSFYHDVDMNDFGFIDDEENIYRENRKEYLREDILSKFLKNINFEVEYFPTYRRIEKEASHSISSEFYSDGINFGMKDVERKIKELTEEIEKETFKDFLEMNNEILIDIIEEKAAKKKITKSEINSISSVIPIVLQRIINSNVEQRHNDIVDKVKALLKNPPKEESKFLPYYLWKMFNIYKKQEKKEKRIALFIEVCNKYLTNKKFIYIAENTSVEIRDIDDEIIVLSSLSSGEKQIVSLFARLYLEEKNDLMIVIDEPELSISMKWQKMLLPDIVNSQKCKLLLVTTHSPFIFHNEFDIYADDLNNYISPYLEVKAND